jgi:carbon monoxide dehydrogenase subunit G
MSDISHFESRTGNLKSTAAECFDFVTDIRNFERFIPPSTISNWTSERESCSFSVSMLGTVSLRIKQKEKSSKVVFDGDALKKNDFELVLHIAQNSNSRAEVSVELNAELNPMMKMIAAKPIGQFLEMLISEMENFSGWKEVTE